MGDAWVGRGEVGGLALEEDCVLELAGASSVNNFVFCRTFFSVYSKHMGCEQKHERSLFCVKNTVFLCIF